MSLITRCPACATMFKVVADQLRVSGGWVRCGHCADVFDATANMQSPPLPPLSQFVPAASVAQPEISASKGDQLVPKPLSEPPAEGLQQSVACDINALHQDSATPEALIPAFSSPAASLGDRLFGVGATSDHDVGDGDQSNFDLAAQEQKNGSGLAHEAEMPDQVCSIPPGRVADMDGVIEPEDTSSGLLASRSSATAAVPEATDDVSFVRDAIRKEFWRKPAIRIILSLLGLLLALVLLFQVVVHQRDALAALEPRLKPALQVLCAEIGCELAPLKRIDVLIIESSSFSRVNADSYRLSFVIKNSGPLAVAIPSLEVTLTDIQEKPVLRRVVLPAQFGAASAILPAGSEFAGLVAFQLSDRQDAGSAAPALPTPIAGYRLLAFYP